MAIEPRVLTDFEGEWQVARDIVHSGDGSAQFRGTASWKADGQKMRYHEHGAMMIGKGTPMTAERRYLWKPDLTVWFEDGRFFHRVPARGGDTAHWCDPDQYDGVYDFSTWPRFVVCWTVRGPKKAYQMTTTYIRLS